MTVNQEIVSDAWPAPAKLNLFLHITGRREDGMHQLQTLFQLLDCCDSLDFRLRRDGQIRRRPGTGPVSPAEQDLAVRAAALLQKVSGCRLGVDIGLRKRLPAGGGLGGGSSDAATALVALNWLWGIRAEPQELDPLGQLLGADVPVFLRGRTAWAQGIGEQLQPYPADRRWFLIIDPGVPVHSTEIYAAPELTRNSPLITMQSFSERATRNDCQSVVRARYPEVGAALDFLSVHAPSRMTGSGGCVFAAFDSQEQAAEAAGEMPAHWRSLIGRGLECSPLQQRLERASIGR